jgi:hypothetical protein
MTSERRDQLIAKVIPEARRMCHAAATKGARTPVVWVRFGRLKGVPGARLSTFDFEESAYRGNKGGMFCLAHEIDGVEATPPGCFPMIVSVSTKQDSIVVHAPLEA